MYELNTKISIKHNSLIYFFPIFTKVFSLIYQLLHLSTYKTEIPMYTATKAFIPHKL